MRVLFDTDVILDFLLEREPFFQAANNLLELNAKGEFEGHISGITPVDVSYIGRKIVGAITIRQCIGDLLKLVGVCPVTHARLYQQINNLAVSSISALLRNQLVINRPTDEARQAVTHCRAGRQLKHERNLRRPNVRVTKYSL